MNESLATHYLQDSIAGLRAYKKQADKAIAQLKDDEFFITIDGPPDLCPSYPRPDGRGY